MRPGPRLVQYLPTQEQQHRRPSWPPDAPGANSRSGANSWWHERAPVDLDHPCRHVIHELKLGNQSQEGTRVANDSNTRPISSTPGQSPSFASRSDSPETPQQPGINACNHTSDTVARTCCGPLREGRLRHSSLLEPHTSHLRCRTSHLTHHTSHLRTHLRPHSSQLRPHNSHLTPHTGHLAPHTSRLTAHTSDLTPQTSHLTPHTAHLTPRTSHLTLPTSHLTAPTTTSHCRLETSHITTQTSQLTPHTSHLALHSSDLTPHTSHPTPHPSYVCFPRSEV